MPPIAKWSVSNTTAIAGQYLTFKMELNAPALKNTWTLITTDNSKAPHVANFRNDKSQVSFDGVNWGQSVYYANYVILPAGQRTIYVRLQIDSTIKQAESVTLTLREDAPNYDHTPISATGSVTSQYVAMPPNAWSVSNTTAIAGQYLTFKLQLNEPALKNTWTLITTDNSKAPHVANFRNDKSQVSFDGVNWGQSVYYANYVILPTGQRTIYVRLKVDSKITQAESVILTAREDAPNYDHTQISATGSVTP